MESEEWLTHEDRQLSQLWENLGNSKVILVGDISSELDSNHPRIDFLVMISGTNQFTTTAASRPRYQF
ncbi:hypothetical protein U1Q18_012552 [Sarracenia purpurea var. burkii]